MTTPNITQTNLPERTPENDEVLRAAVVKAAAKYLGLLPQAAVEMVLSTFTEFDGRVPVDAEFNDMTNDLLIAGAAVMCERCEALTTTGYAPSGYPTKATTPHYCSRDCFDEDTDERVARLP